MRDLTTWIVITILWSVSAVIHQHKVEIRSISQASTNHSPDEIGAPEVHAINGKEQAGSVVKHILFRARHASARVHDQVHQVTPNWDRRL